MSSGSVTQRCARKRGIKVVLGQFEEGRQRPQQRLCFGRGFDRGSVIAGEEAHLQLADAVQACGDRQAGILLQMSLEPRLIQARVVEAAEGRARATQCADQLELCGDVVDHYAIPHLAREVTTDLGLPLHLR